MELGNNPESWGRMPAGGATPLLDWQGLRARFLAGYGVREAFAAAPVEPVAGGSFDGSAARIIGRYGRFHDQSLSPVNPSASGDSNAPDGTNEPVSGNKRPVIEE